MNEREPTKREVIELILMYARRISYALRDTGHDIKIVCVDGRNDSDDHSHPIYVD